MNTIRHDINNGRLEFKCCVPFLISDLSAIEAVCSRCNKTVSDPVLRTAQELLTNIRRFEEISHSDLSPIEISKLVSERWNRIRDREAGGGQ